jgi:triphosphoribosyl-dephospho-CoA synthase
LGLLVAAASGSTVSAPHAVAAIAGSIARVPDVPRPQLLSHGDLVANQYRVGGARDEARADFPHVVKVGIPALRAARSAGKSETASRLTALLSIMAELDDTCVLYRGGCSGAEKVKGGAAVVLSAGGPGTAEGNAALHHLDRELLEERLSPGGSADLFAAALFLDCLDAGVEKIREDRSLEEGLYGGN